MDIEQAKRQELERMMQSQRIISGTEDSGAVAYAQSSIALRHDNFNHVWVRQLESLLFRQEHFTNPRGKETLEQIGVQLKIDMREPILTVEARDLGYKFMAAEAWWILTGRDDVASIAPYSKAISSFSDDGVKFFGAYGPKIQEQRSHVITALINDVNTRQAVINIWRENPPETKDTPCTLSLQWLLRAGKLHCVATMRSSDIWLGVPYDVFNFSMLTWHLCLILKHVFMIEVEPGQLTLNLGSSHLYAKDIYGALKCIQNREAWVQCGWNGHLNVNSAEPVQLVKLLELAKDSEEGIKSLMRVV